MQNFKIYLILASVCKIERKQVQFSSVVQSCSTVCNPVDCSTPGSLSITDTQRLLKFIPPCRWFHPTISSSVVPFSCYLQSFPASRSFPMSQFFASSGQSIGASASASVLPVNIQDWFPLGSGYMQSLGSQRVNTTEGRKSSNCVAICMGSKGTCITGIVWQSYLPHTLKVTLRRMRIPVGFFSWFVEGAKIRRIFLRKQICVQQSPLRKGDDRLVLRWLVVQVI